MDLNGLAESPSGYVHSVRTAGIVTASPMRPNHGASGLLRPCALSGSLCNVAAHVMLVKEKGACRTQKLVLHMWTRSMGHQMRKC